MLLHPHGAARWPENRPADQKTRAGMQIDASFNGSRCFPLPQTCFQAYVLLHPHGTARWPDNTSADQTKCVKLMQASEGSRCFPVPQTNFQGYVLLHPHGAAHWPENRPADQKTRVLECKLMQASTAPGASPCRRPAFRPVCYSTHTEQHVGLTSD